ncbi:cysteine hydrolase family protein [Orbus mooreae]|uniref:cysteine hydrolase family protein n=1 Tax=Orbus mooreae TaxID=3074107 RepID=UPI00370D3081
MENTALLIIDVQQGLFGPTPMPYNALTVVNNINILIAKARTKNIPIIFIQHEDAQELRYLSDNWQLYSLINASSNDYVVRKTTPDSFNHTELSKIMQKLNITHCVICGYATEFCIDTSTRQAAVLNYAVTLVNDAHTTHDKNHLDAAKIIQHHTISLSSMTSFSVPIIAKPTQDIEF